MTYVLHNETQHKALIHYTQNKEFIYDTQMKWHSAQMTLGISNLFTTLSINETQQYNTQNWVL